MRNKIKSNHTVHVIIAAIVCVILCPFLLSRVAHASDIKIPTPVIRSVFVGSSYAPHRGEDDDRSIRIELEQIDDDYAEYYEVLYGTNSNPDTPLHITENQTTTLRSDERLTSGMTYYFKVRRCHGSRKSEWSAVYKYKFVQVEAPVIKNVSVQYNWGSPTVYVSWNSVSNADKYMVVIERYHEDWDTYSLFDWEYGISRTYYESYSSRSIVPNEKLYVWVKAYTEDPYSYSEASERYEITMPNIVVDEITLDHKSLSLKVGDQKYIRETILPVDATNRTVLWTSSNTDAATVSSNGQVTAVSEGRSVITCSSLYGDAFAVCEVIVTGDETGGETSPEVSVGSGKCGDNATWELDETGLLRISGTGAVWENNLTRWYNLREYIKEIEVEEGISEIGSSSFIWCSNLVSVKLPNSLTSIKRANFQGCKKLSEITIPKNVSSIGESVFLGCDALSKINVAGGNRRYFSIDGVLYDASTFTLVAYPANKEGSAYSVPDGIEHIGESAFYAAMNLKSVVLPDSVKTIGSLAFYSCKNLTACNIPNGVYNIASSAFSQTGLAAAILPSSVEALNLGVFSYCEKLDYIVIPKSVMHIGNNAFRNCDNVTHVNYEGSESEWDAMIIGTNNEALVNAVINYNCTHVHSGGAATCSARAVCEECGSEYGAVAHSLTYVDRKAATCQEPGWDAYEECSVCSYSTYKEQPLDSHKMDKHGAFPAACEAEGNITYYKCSVCEQIFSDPEGEHEISLEDTVVAAVGHSYSEKDGKCVGCGEIKPGYCGANITWELDEQGVLTISGTGEMWETLPWDPAAIKEVVIHDGVTNISAEAFYGCTGLTSVSIPNSVAVIGAKAFYGAPLKQLVIPSGVETLEENALYGCSKLEELTVPFTGGSQSNNTSLGYIFQSSTSSWKDPSSGAILFITNYYLPATLKKVTITDETAVTKWSFEDCSNIEVLVLPSTLTKIDPDAFADCKKLTDIYFTGTETVWESLFQGELTAAVHFIDVAVTAITLNKTELTLMKGDLETLTAVISPGHATNRNVVWASSNENVAAVENGTVIAKREGTTTITASSGDGKQTAACTVTVGYKAKISVFDYRVVGPYAIIDLSVDHLTGDAVWFFAAYDDTGRMLEAQTSTLTDGAARIILSAGTPHKIKAFVLGDGLQPVTCVAEKML